MKQRKVHLVKETEETNKEHLESLFTKPSEKASRPMASKLDELQAQIDALQKEREELLQFGEAGAI